MKMTQDAMSSVYHYVPMQDFTRSWTDEDLFKKYGLSKEETDYIKSIVKTMA